MLDKANDALIGSRTTLSSLSKAAQLNYATKIVKIWSLRWSRCRDCPWGLWPCRVNCRWRVFKETQDKNGLFQEKKNLTNFSPLIPRFIEFRTKKSNCSLPGPSPTDFIKRNQEKLLHKTLPIESRFSQTIANQIIQFPSLPETQCNTQHAAIQTTEN